MWSIPMTLAAICLNVTPGPATTTADLLARIRLRQPQLFEAPALQEWPQGLTRHLRTPVEAVCYAVLPRDKLRLLSDGLWLPGDRAAAVLEKLAERDTYPIKAQGRIDALIGAILEENICSAVGEAVGEISAADATVGVLEKTDRYFTFGSVIKWSSLVGILSSTIAVVITVILTR